MARRILIVEDDEKSRRLMTDVLSFHGYQVAVAVSGEEGLRSASAAAPDAALLDIQLPGMSGFELLAALRAPRAGARLPVIAVTASVTEQDRRKVLAAGFDAFVSKPVNIRELLQTLDELLERGRP